MIGQTRRKFISYFASVPFVVSGAKAAKAGTTHKINISDFAFTPATLTIKAGDTVRWTNRGDAPHTADDKAGKWRTGTLKRGNSGQVTFDKAGKFNYACKFHPAMKGKISVT